MASRSCLIDTSDNEPLHIVSPAVAKNSNITRIAMVAPGQIIAQRYMVRETLGQGGFGAVYIVWDNRLNRQVALKSTFEHSASAVRQFEMEAELLARLRHPNLPTVSDHFAEGNQHFLVMDYVPGE